MQFSFVFSSAKSWPCNEGSLVLRLINLHVVDRGPDPCGPAADAVELSLIDRGGAYHCSLGHGGERRPFVLRQLERFGYSCCRPGIVEIAAGVIELGADGSEARKNACRGVGGEFRPRVSGSEVALGVSGDYAGL